MSACADSRGLIVESCAFPSDPDFGWSATSEASNGTPEGGLFKKTAK